MAGKRLRPGGIMSAWAPTDRIRATALLAFAHAIDFGTVLLLSNEPIAIDLDLWDARLRSARSVDYLGIARINEIAPFMLKAREGARPHPDTEINRDLDPRDEFIRPRNR